MISALVSAEDDVVLVVVVDAAVDVASRQHHRAPQQLKRVDSVV